MKKVLLPVLLFCCIAVKSFAQPATNPESLPALTPAQVISIYTDNFYGDLTGVNFNPNWGQSGFATATTFTLTGNNMRSYPNMNYQGIDLTRPVQGDPVVNAPQNVSSLDTLHLDVWSSNCTSLDVYLVTDGFGERLINRPLTLGTWNRLKIPLSAYAALGIPLTGIKEFKFVTVAPGSGANIFVDNIFFYTTKTLPTLSNFVMPSKMLGDAPFVIAPPTSNSAGAFTYSSSNTNVATINGNEITILKAGSSLITANQAASAPYAAGSISSTLVVSVAPLSTNPPAPTKPGNRVISLFSDSYENVPVTTWRTGWSGAGPVSDTVIAGNNIKKYTAVDFVGIELPPIDVTLADSVHISVWTPTASTFALKLVNLTGPNGNEQRLRENIVRYSGLPGLHFRPAPAQGQWNVFSLPLSLFATPNGGDVLTNRNQLFQILFTGAAPFSDNTYYIDDLYFSSVSNILPVKITSFTAVKKDKTVVLNWQTATETNNKGFAVERSTDGQRWNEFSFVKASGSSTGAQYQANDATPQKGMNFYRLKQVDNDGQVTYSAVKAVNFNDAGGRGVLVYPNPARGVVKVFTGDQIGNTRYSLISADGRVLKSGVIAADSNVYSLDVSTVAAGTYVLKLNGENSSSQTKLILY